MDPLASEGDWTAYLDDESTGLVYYFNKKTGASLWEPPTDTFPPITLKGRKRRKAREKQLEFVKAAQDKPRKGFLSGLLDSDESGKTAGTALQEPEKKKEGDEWFGGMFEEPVDLTKQPTKNEQETPKKGFLSSLLDGDDNAGDSVGGTATKKPERESSPKKGGFLSGLLESAETDEAPTLKEPTKEPEQVSAAKMGGFLSGLMESVKTDEVPTLEPTKQQAIEPKKGGFLSGLMESVKTDEAPSLEEPTKVPEQVIEPKKGGFLSGLMESVRADEEEQETEEKIVVPVEKPVNVDISAFVLPHPSKIFWGGEDAVFVKGRTFGVFDGVSGAFKTDGVPLYSKTLATEMQKSAPDDGLSQKELLRLLTLAAETADEKATGASTAVVASITEDGYLRALNVGDSACVVVRNGKIVSKTREISHYFECPYQLSEDSPDRPRDGTKLNVALQRGDLVVMASDGVFDNLSDEKVVEVVQNGNQKPSAIAKRLSDVSRTTSLNRQVVTPYAVQARNFGDPDYSDGIGGKLDDVSCVVVRYE